MRVSQWFSHLAQVSFALTLVTTPFRLRSVLISRPAPPIYSDYTDVLLFISDGFLLAVLAFWLIDRALDPRRLDLGPPFLTLPILALTAAGLASVFFSIDPLLSAYHAARLIALAGLTLYVLNEVKSMDRLVLPVSIQIFIQAVVGIAQVMGQRDLGFQAIGEYELDPAWRGVSIVWAEGIRSLRAYGLSDHPNLLGGCFAFGLVLLAAWHPTARPRAQVLNGAVFALGALGLLLTFSRSAWLALVMGGGLIFILTLRRRPQREAVDLLFLAVAGLIVLSPFLLRFAPYIGVRLNAQGSFTTVPQEVQALGSRPLLNAAANQIFAENALTGAGLGSFPLALRQRFPVFRIDYQPAHFVLLDVAAETGIFGALFYTLVLTLPWLALWLNRRRLVFTPALIGASGLLLALTVVGFFDYYTWLLVPGRLWQWLGWGLWAAAYRSARREVGHA